MKWWVPALRLTGIGFYVVACILGGTLAGYWLGGKRPVFMLVGLVAGLLVAVYGIYKMLRPFINQNREKENGA